MSFKSIVNGQGVITNSIDANSIDAETVRAKYIFADIATNTFAAVATTATTAAYSTNGITWTETTMPASAGWFSVTHGISIV